MSEPEASEKLVALAEAECVRLLRSHDLGRIALVDPKVHPLIFPVNYVFDEGVVVFRTGPGTKLDLVAGVPVTFEIDGWAPNAGIGWSVLVKGIAHDITNPRDRLERMHRWPVRPAAPGVKEHWIGIWPTEITGRRFQR